MLEMKVFDLVKPIIARRKYNLVDPLSHPIFDDTYCLEVFKFTKDEMILLRVKLEIPDQFQISPTQKIPGITALAILLHCLSRTETSICIARAFHTSRSTISRAYNKFLDFLNRHPKLQVLVVFNQKRVERALPVYAAAIAAMGCLVSNCICFVECARPRIWQRDLYSGHT